jgi:hypothetical protein
MVFVGEEIGDEVDDDETSETTHDRAAPGLSAVMRSSGRTTRSRSAILPIVCPFSA